MSNPAAIFDSVWNALEGQSSFGARCEIRQPKVKNGRLRQRCHLNEVFRMSDNNDQSQTSFFMKADVKKKRESEHKTIEVDPTPKGEWRVLAGADHDEWNLRQANLVLAAPPGGKQDNEVNTAIVSGMVDMKPASHGQDDGHSGNLVSISFRLL